VRNRLHLSDKRGGTVRAPRENPRPYAKTDVYATCARKRCNAPVAWCGGGPRQVECPRCGHSQTVPGR
jgi:hypothetical protein